MSENRSVEDEIKLANELGDKMQDLVVARGQFTHEDRKTLLMAYWSLVFELHRAILCLIHHKFFGAAFALVRPLVEAAARAHVAIMGSEEDLKAIKDDEYRTRFKTIGKEIDAYFKTENLFENFLERAKAALHSYAHSGMMQVSRRFSGTEVTPRFSDEEIIQAIHNSSSAVFIVNNLVTKYLGFDDEWSENSRLFYEWGERTNKNSREFAAGSRD